MIGCVGSSKMKYLLNVKDEYELSYIKTLFDENQIPVHTIRKGIGEYTNIYMGLDYEGISIYVPEDYFKRALEIINNKYEETIDEELLEEERIYSHKRRKRAWIIISIFYFSGFVFYMISKILS